MANLVSISSSFGAILLVMWGIMAFGIAWPPLGRRLLKPLWPGQFIEPNLRQSATRYWRAMLSGQALIALNIILNQFQVWYPSSSILWYLLRMLTIVVSLLCFVQANRFHQRLPQSSTQSSFRRNDFLVLVLGLIPSFFVLVAGIALLPYFGMNQRAASLVASGSSIGCYVMWLVYMLRKRRTT